MKKTSQVIWGIILIGIGTVWALNAFGLTDIDLFFDGGVGSIRIEFEEE